MSKRVLVIEDNPANLELMTYLLRAYKYEALSAEDGEQGLAIAQAERPDIVICDIQLPKMDGYEVVRRLKLDAATRAIPVVAVTAFAMVGDRDRALAAGFDGYIGKPITPETFVSQVERFLGNRPAAQPRVRDEAGQAVAPSRARRAGARILVVDNTPSNRDLFVSTLSPVGYDVVATSNVKTALEKAQATKPALIISDMHMPGMSGLDFLDLVKSDPALSDVPFMFASCTTWDENAQRAALHRGADLFFLRPSEPRSLLESIDALLAKKENGHGDDPGR